MRVLHAPVNIANQAWGMAQGLRALGHHAEVWEIGATAFDYPADRRIPATSSARTVVDLVAEAAGSGFDVVHFHFARTLVGTGTGLPWFWDLPVWRALGTRIAMTFHGSDVRLRSHHLATDEWSFYRFGDVPCDEELVAERLEVLLAYADVTTVGSILDTPYVPGAVVLPKVIDPAALPDAPLAGTRSSGPPVVAHAPSRRATKGTDFVLAGLDQLRERGVAFDVDLIEGVPNAEALDRMARADVVVEKLLGGDVGVTSLEAMALGKVTVARIRPEVRDHAPDLPTVSADPATFVDVMADLLAAPDRLPELGAQGRDYVARVNAPAVVGRRLAELYTGPRRRTSPIPPGWTEPGLSSRVRAAERSVARLRADNRRLRALLAGARPVRFLSAARRRLRPGRVAGPGGA